MNRRIFDYFKNTKQKVAGFLSRAGRLRARKHGEKTAAITKSFWRRKRNYILKPRALFRYNGDKRFYSMGRKYAELLEARGLGRIEITFRNISEIKPGALNVN